MQALSGNTNTFYIYAYHKLQLPSGTAYYIPRPFVTSAYEPLLLKLQFTFNDTSSSIKFTLQWATK